MSTPKVPNPARPPQGAPLRERLQATLFDAPARPASPSSSPTVAPAGSTPRRETSAAPTAPRIPISISELTDRLSRQLAIGFSSVCVLGEISRVQTVASGHTYFTLKDAGASIEAMVWADRLEELDVQPRQGMRVVVVGAVRIFAASGRYSLHVEKLEAVGAGDLQRALEALVTSATGAVRHDIERTLEKGLARVRLVLAPSRVQGEGAGLEIAAAIRQLGSLPDIDVIVVARGGGSIEELWPFNEEAVARAIAASAVPVISAVGHETDYTISDFVADVRASTPSVAAAMIVDIQRQARQRVENASVALRRAMEANREKWRRRLDAVSTHRVIERERTRLERLRGRLGDVFLRVRADFDRGHARRRAVARDLVTRCEAQAPHERLARVRAGVDRALLSMRASMARRFERSRTRAHRAFESRALRAPAERLAVLREVLRRRVDGLERNARPMVDRRKERFGAAAGRLEALSPLAVLNRGYALATTAEGRILFDASTVKTGDAVQVRLAKGRVIATVTAREEEK
jgi:exodeoxyribonuclease VII large subunit